MSRWVAGGALQLGGGLDDAGVAALLGEPTSATSVAARAAYVPRDEYVPGGGGVALSQHPTYPGLLVVDSAVTQPENFAPSVTIDSVLGEALNATVTFTGSDADNDPLSYSIAWGDGQTTGAATSPATHTYAAGGEYTVTVTVSDGAVTGTASATVTAVDAAGASVYSQAVMADAPVLYYPLDDAAAPAVDATGTTTATSALWPTFGAVPIGDGTTAADFGSNTGAQVVLGQPAALNNLADFTIEALVQPDGNAASGLTIVSRDDATAARSYALRRELQKFRVLTLSGATVAISTATDYPAGSVYHLAVVRSGSTVTMYVNGIADGTGTAADSLGAPNTPHLIGARTGAAATTFDGRIAGVAIYNKALTQARIQAHKSAAGL